jgi:hypothetical protein
MPMWPRSRIASANKPIREAEGVRKIALTGLGDSAPQGDFAHPTELY